MVFAMDHGLYTIILLEMFIYIYIDLWLEVIGICETILELEL
jgi:hypothetical protein